MAFQISRIRKIRAFAQRWGWPRTAFAMVMRIAGDYLGFHIYLIRGRHITSTASCPMKRPAIRLALVDRDALVQSLNDPELDLDQQFVDEALERGDLAFGAFDDNRLVAYTWRTVTEAPHTDTVGARVAHPYSYAYKSFTSKSYRGYRILPALILYSDDAMEDAGYTHRVGFIAVTNFSSLAVGKYIHTHKIGYAGYLKWFGWIVPFRTRPVKKIEFEFFESKEH